VSLSPGGRRRIAGASDGSVATTADQPRELRRGVEILRARLDTLRLDEASGPHWGAMRAEDIVAWQDFLLASGAIGRRLLPETYYSAAFLERFNDFDSEVVRARARTFRGRQ
jgi:hypothetical protein